MKKFSAILMATLVLFSMCVFTVSAEGEAVNYAQAGVYAYGETSTFLASTDGSTYYGDDACTILTDGENPYYMPEEPGKGVVLTGSGTTHTIIFDLGATYDDVYEIVLGNVWDSVTFGYVNGENGKGNRGFNADKAMIRISADGVNFERTKDFEIVKTNHTEDGSENGFYDYTFKFNAPATIKAVELLISSPAYCLSLSEIEIWGYGHSIPTPEVSFEDETTEEIVDETSEEAEETTEASVEESKAEESKAEESKVESKAEESKAEEAEGTSPVIFIVIGVVVVAIIAVVVVISKKKKN